MGFVFVIHLALRYAFSHNLWAHQLIESYVFNLSIALLTVGCTSILIQQGSKSVGFVFMGFSALKFLYFFVRFYPSYKSDGVIETAEALTFFIPYLTALILETILIAKGLNNSGKTEDQDQ